METGGGDSYSPHLESLNFTCFMKYIHPSMNYFYKTLAGLFLGKLQERLVGQTIVPASVVSVGTTNDTHHLPVLLLMLITPQFHLVSLLVLVTLTSI